MPQYLKLTDRSVAVHEEVRVLYTMTVGIGNTASDVTGT